MNRAIFAKRLSLIVVLLVVGSAFADLGNDWPDSAELAKAPPWPKKYDGNPFKCMPVSEEAFLKQVNPKGETDPFRVERQIDLNMDGTCELVAYQPSMCGKWCGYVAFLLRDGNFVNIGGVILSEYLEPDKGWLQLKAASYTGSTYFYFLFRFDGQQYRIVRRDEFKTVPVNGKRKTVYIKTTEQK